MKCSDNRKGGTTQLLQIGIYINKAEVKRRHLCALLSTVLLLTGCVPITAEGPAYEPTPMPTPVAVAVAEAEEEQISLPPGILMLGADSAGSDNGADGGGEGGGTTDGDGAD